MSTAELRQLDRTLGRCFEDAVGCWVFTGSRDVNGYGQLTFRGRRVLVHRFVYTVMVDEIPEGLQIDHLCRNRSCCNPAHLEPVTRAVNAARTPAGRRGQAVAERELAKSHCPRGHAYDDENTYRNAKGHRWCRACRREKYAERNAA